MTKRLVFDVESVGLHGEGFAVGYVILDDDGVVRNEGAAFCPLDAAAGADDDRAWVKEHVTHDHRAFRLANPRAVRDWFWPVVQAVKEAGGEVWTDCGWPVEANFLSACVADNPGARKWAGPYPLLDVAVVLKAAGRDPLGTYLRLPNEQPAHNALRDATQSARILLEALSGVE